MDPPKVKMGKLAQKFNLGQRNCRAGEQAAASGRSGQAGSPLASHSHPLQLPGSQVLRRDGGSDVPMAPLSMVGETPNGPRPNNAPYFGAPSGPVSTSCSAPMVSKEIDNPETLTQEQGKILDLESRLRVATQRVQDLEEDARTHAEELLVARTQARIDIDQEVVRLQQEVETLGEHEDRLIRELVASESKLKGLKTTERDLKKRLSHFHTIYCLKHAYDDHLKRMKYTKQNQAKRLHHKFLETEAQYMEAAFELYDYLEANGLQDTLPADVKALLADPKGRKGCGSPSRKSG